MVISMYPKQGFVFAGGGGGGGGGGGNSYSLCNDAKY